MMQTITMDAAAFPDSANLERRWKRQLMMLKEIYNVIVNTTRFPPEMGGILGSDLNGVVIAAVFDKGVKTAKESDSYSYTPNVDFLNRQIEQWQHDSIRFCGLFHSHPVGQESLSGADKEYIEDILKAMPPSVKALYFPLVIDRKIISFRAVLKNDKLCILQDGIIIKKRS